MFALMDRRRAELKALYAGPGRHYHNETHIEALLRHCAAVHERLAAPAAVELAIWYHDAVYVPLARDNEAQSAALFRRHFAGLLAPELVTEVAAMILATERHLLPDTGPPAFLADCALFLDLDLSILGAPPDIFARYEAAIRQEYAAVPDAAYRTGRAAVLEGFQARNRLYFSDHFRVLLEAPARRNLAASLASLAQ